MPCKKFKNLTKNHRQILNKSILGISTGSSREASVGVDFGRKMLKIPAWTHKHTQNHPRSTTTTPLKRARKRKKKTKSRVQAGLLPAVEGQNDRHSLIPHPPSPVPSVTPRPTWIRSEWGGGGREMPRDQ